VSLPIRQVWTFTSDSNPYKEYETLQYLDGSTSCNCKGWTRRVAADGSRCCKHTRYVDLQQADRHCIATHRYQTNQTKSNSHEKHPLVSLPKLGQRKFAV
jgi:hypothetical protein